MEFLITNPKFSLGLKITPIQQVCSFRLCSSWVFNLFIKTIMGKLIFTLLILFFTFSDSPKLVKVKLSKTVSASVPNTFTLMTDDELADKYPSSRKPVVMYISPDKQVDFGMNVASQKFPGSDLNILKDFYKANLYTLFNNVEIISEEIRNIKGQNFIKFEFTSEIKPEGKSITPVSSIRKYSYIQYTLYNDYLLIFNFSCPVSIKKDWEETASDIMKSIRLSKGTKSPASEKSK